MTLRRRRLWLVALAGLVLAGGVWAWSVGFALSTKDASRIKIGMNLGQVSVVLGRPPDAVTENYLSDGFLPIDYWYVIDGSIGVVHDGIKVDDVWITDDGVIETTKKRIKRFLDKYSP